MEILIVAYGLAIVTEAIHQFTLRKREFLFAVLCLVAGTWIGYFLDRTMVKMAFAAGISFSFLGDLAMARRLKITGKRIIDGIIFFSIAHILYFWGIIQLEPIHWEIAIPSAIAVGSVGYWKTAYEPKKTMLSLGALFYAAIISTLFAVILARFLFFPSLDFFTSLCGIALFVSSDMMIAFREFKRDFQNSERWISATYLLGQTLLLSSIFWIGA